MRKNTMLALAAAAALWFLSVGTAMAQPGWCNANRLNLVEGVICDTQMLWGLDHALNTAYRRARHDSPKQRGYIKRKQKQWIRSRNRCGYDVYCIQNKYNQQIYWLEGFFYN